MDVTGKEMIINRKEMALKKVEKIKAGYSAFAESKEVSDFIRKELKRLGIDDVYEDITELGSWFIPANQRDEDHK
ncbi:hypothetical protein P4637_05240 [Halalkalibacterium halodurans]|jgi:hypothetical protein|uniref:BH3172 protein n=2 Tax=Halalkalibacterium halodurans TaxID=86665 RepID=Q9K835_HALH5|nr:hypothetical protein [Halalkalibacterium halodurans]MDY7223705.1 hypothetical protein [Halalkalibacterium halodurans]MDY7242926.1 hypothetical protein [Halalkalibacterium halodurans]MED3648018.1 hypothetical protein [Halalkalibacterium halodurans]MED4082154.1 hypothetical protein [Halalkalibacterium halodurans]MED4084268.1 hypothetical protein [Halalkalibacterium halodurans]